MVNQITVRICENISHLGVPTEIINQGEKRQNTSTKGVKNQGYQIKGGRKTKGDKEESS